MDPGTLLNEGSFMNASATSYNVAGIWQFPMNGGGVNVAELGLRRPLFGHDLSQCGDVLAVNWEASVNDPINLDNKGSQGGEIGGNGGARKRRNVEDDSAKGVSTSSGNGVTHCERKRLKTSACEDDNHESKAEAETGSGNPIEQNNRLPDQHKQDYIHVRARRGQATDSHSLAERARREKISERMKILQDLVPGCNKVIGKALVLDEIINYIQSLQSQVEFLSMKLEAVNSRISPAIDIFSPKDFSQQTLDTTVMAFPPQPTREFSRGSSPEWLHMQVRGGFERTT